MMCKKTTLPAYRLAGGVQPSAVHPPGEFGRRPGPVGPARQLVLPAGRQRLQLPRFLAVAVGKRRYRRHFRRGLRQRRRLQIVVGEVPVVGDRQYLNGQRRNCEQRGGWGLGGC